MDLLQRCQKWHEEGQYQKIIEALKAIPAENRSPEMDSELARAYNNWGALCSGREAFKKAIALLKPHEEYFADDYFWNFRIGYSHYCLEQEGRALRYFEKALENRPDDEDTGELIESCKRGIALPRFSECFRERTESAWKEFAGQEAQLRRMMDEDADHARSEEIVDKMEKTLQLAFDEISFEMGTGGGKYELILTPEGDKVKLFELVYFQKHAPKEVLEHWNILVGRQPSRNIGLRTGDGWDICGEDVQIWLEEQGENSFAVFAYCEKLLPMLREERNRAWWMLTTLTDQLLGEIPQMRYIGSFDLLESPRPEPSILLSQLPDQLRERGKDLSTDPEDYLQSYVAYKMNPEEDPDADWRFDTIAGSTNCVPLLNGYLNADNDFIDELHADGTVAGFFCYPLDSLREEKGSQKIFDFRNKLEKALSAKDGPELLTLTGGATGLYCGYLDFIAWDIGAALRMAKEFFEESDIPWASFHTFRREAGTVTLKKAPEKEDGRERENCPDGEPSEENPALPEVYTEEEMETVEGHIQRYFGRFETVFHELVSTDIHVDICVVPPAGEQNYYTLVTMGMGAHRMKVPAELAQYKLERAELAIALPKDWKLKQEDLEKEQWYWPIRLLKNLARLPIICDTWLGFGHTMDNEEHFAEGTELCAALLTGPRDAAKDSEVCILPGGEEVNFYQVIPLYRDELEYKLTHGADALLEKMTGISFVTSGTRPDAMGQAGSGEEGGAVKSNAADRRGQDFGEDTPEPTALAKTLMEYLDCECSYLPPMKDDDPIMTAYSRARQESAHAGFVPLLIRADDEILWECLILNSDPDSDGAQDNAVDSHRVAQYREKMLSAPVGDGRAELEELIGRRRAETGEDGLNWEEVLGEMEGGDANDRFSSYWNYDTGMTHPLILAKIPVKNPWEIFAYLPFGNWNECPDTPRLMAAAKYWFEQYGAVPAAMSHDELEFLLPAPVPEEKAMEAAVELYGFCPDTDQNFEEIGALADALRQSTVWYLWWD